MVTVFRSSSSSPKSSSSSSILRRLPWIMASFAILLLIVTLFLQESYMNAAMAAAMPTDDLVELIRDLKGQDERLMRWDATEHTAKRQAKGACDRLPEAMTTVLLAKETKKEEDDVRRRLACEYATFCITDNPYQRAKFSEQEGIYEAVVKAVKNGSPETSAMAGHLIYIASFSNEKNQQSFFQAGAVEALAGVITSSTSNTKKGAATSPVQVMWAMAALQNLSASYCATKHDGRCYWGWPEKTDHLEMESDSLPIVSDGAPIRQAALKIPNLITTLQEYACQGPVAGPASETNILVGENAMAGRDDHNPAIVPWAAAGALKNLALETEARGLIGGPSMACYCALKESNDWLEEAKAFDLLLHLRPHDPCWNEEEGAGVCIDGVFLDKEGYYCDDYGEPTEEECKATDVFTGKSAHELCCGCGGGERFFEAHEEL